MHLSYCLFAAILAVLSSVIIADETSINIQGVGIDEIRRTHNNGIDFLKQGEIFASYTAQQLQSITTIWLQSNCIQKIHAGAFDRIPNLEYVYLGNNSISHIDEQAFKESTVKQIFLNNNKFQHFPSKAFANSMLLSIDLGYNGIKEVEKSDFKGLTSLAALYLYGNKIEKLDDGVFADLTNLRSLFLFSNFISKIRKETFSHLDHLTQLHLQSNKIVVVPFDVFDAIKNTIQSIHLEGNPVVDSPTCPNGSHKESIFHFDDPTLQACVYDH